MTAKKPKREENKNKFQLKKIESRMFFGQAVKKETSGPSTVARTGEERSGCTGRM
jgi:hypothetical protein